MARDTQVPPFGATVAGANALVPEARLLDTPPVAGAFGVTVAQAEAWVTELTGRVAMRLSSWQKLTTDVVDPETTSDRDQLVAYARDVIHNGAASYIEAARFPERSSVNDTSYAAVLWARFTEGLDALDVWLKDRLTAGDDGTDGDVPPGAPSAAGSFPRPTFPDPCVLSRGFSYGWR